ncbi:MAG TPA: tetratricopeptide repeat protein [Gemmatimonadaceae bacterium]|nr:tetratricopeptide repeat protein [Gemmatimonadaceae bacterium]
MSASTTARTRWLTAILASLALIACAYAGSWRNAFHFDDTHVVESNPSIRSLVNAPSFFTDARTFSSLPANQTYRPLVSLTLAVDHAVARATTGEGLDPRAYHATQLLLLVLAAVLLGGVAWRLYREAAHDDAGLGRHAAAAALVAATLFAVHVANSQVGNYISARSESLSAVGLLGAFLLYLRGGVWRRYHVYLVPMALAALAKPPAILFAPLLLLWRVLVEEDLGPAALRTPAGRQALWRAVRGAIPALVAAAAIFLFVEGMNPPEQTYGGGGLLPYLWTQLWVSARYAGLFVLPVGLSADSDWVLLPSPFDPRVIAGAALLGASLWLAWRAAGARRTRPIAFGLLWFWIGLAPTAVVPLAEVTNDHRPFLAYLGLTMAVVWAAVLLLRRTVAPAQRTRVSIVLAALLLVAHAVGTRARSRVWATDASLWANVVRVSPGNARGLMNYGLTAMRGGRYGEARTLFDSAARLAPAYPLIHVNLGIVTAAQGDTAAAEASFHRALALAPGHADAHRFYARWLAGAGRGGKALAHYARAVELRPTDVGARTEQLLLLAAAGSPQASSAAREILALDPGDAAARALAAGQPSVAPLVDSSATRLLAERWYLAGWAFTQAGRHAEAVQAYRAAVTADSTHATAWNNLGWSLGRLGFMAEAEPALERAVRLAPGHELARNNLAWVRGERARGGDAAVAP